MSPSRLQSRFWPHSFVGACMLSLAMMLLLVVWIFLDASFRWIPHIVGRDLQLQFLSDPELRLMHEWQVYGLRLLIFAVLMVVAIASTLTVFAQLVIGRKRDRSIRSMLLATALVALWLGFFAAQPQLSEIAFRQRILRHLPAMKSAADRLANDWPSETVHLPGLGDYTLHNGKLVSSILPLNRSIFREVVFHIRRMKNGDLTFTIISSYPTHDCAEYRRSGSRPVSRREPAPDGWPARPPGRPEHMVTRNIVSCNELDECWYLVRYDVSHEDAPVIPFDKQRPIDEP